MRKDSNEPWMNHTILSQKVNDYPLGNEHIPSQGTFEEWFSFFPRLDMLVPWRVITKSSSSSPSLKKVVETNNLQTLHTPALQGTSVKAINSVTREPKESWMLKGSGWLNWKPLVGLKAILVCVHIIFVYIWKICIYIYILYTNLDDSMWFVKMTFFWLKVDESWNQFFDELSCGWNRTYKSTKVARTMIPTKQRLRRLKGCDLVPTLSCQDSVLTLATLKWDHLGGGIYDTWFYRWIVPGLSFSLLEKNRALWWKSIYRCLAQNFKNYVPFLELAIMMNTPKRKWNTVLFKHFRWDVAVPFEWLRCLTSFNLQVGGNCWESMGRNDQLNISCLGGPW